MANAGTQIVCLTVLTLSACILSAVSIQDEAVHFCLGQPQTFTCEVPKQGSLTRLEWRIDFEQSTSETSVTRVFTSSDPEGQILRDDRPGVRFVFNLTSNSSSSLVSVMTLSVDDINATALINNATINCGSGDNSEPFPAVLHIIESPPSQTNLTYDLMKVRWNPVTLAYHYIITVSPAINDNESESTFITSNTTIHLPLQYNRDYNISVMASNCAGNSTPAQISMRVGYCTLSTSELREINFISSGYIEGSQISFYCGRDEGNEPVNATCMKNGYWSPDPHAYKCQNNDHEIREVTSKEIHVDVQITSITASLLAFAILTFITGFFLGALLVRCIMKSPKKDEVVPVPGSVTLYEEITQPPSSSALTGQEFEVMKIEANEAYGCI